MTIKLYPEFNDVFADETLKGIFFPLCSLTLEKYPNKIFHFISSNGLWIDENHQTEQNTFNYALFDIQENKYRFNGNIQLYKGFEQAKNIFDELQKDMDNNGKSYLEKKTKTDDYIKKQKQNLNLKTDDEFDADYYLQTFYEFSINRLNFKYKNEFGAFRKIIDGWSNSNKESPIIYDETSNELKETLNHYDKPKFENIETFDLIGKIVGFEFFTDGNDTILFYNNSDKILCLNFYS
ncbi:hypothetical protein [Flavobacterium reichenbachii]|uniref:Uncharacterized protein n=1 Tax=Flavobacterium reichenbachii TaxID=362418 RepID=A0A085ZMU7_9FLAO|nr:hypothetical protein [Flavobacterium reichenbachii]KFF05761.1 hypothetical protein IW19_09620 [Flavobacterium reichenbachii]OXB12650.1 hypothetical protein B0A68_17830 [Flavobacterium reichenbachii]